MPIIIYRAWFIMCVLVFGVFSTGCRTQYNLKLKPIINYPAVERLNMGVALVLENEFAGGALYETQEPHEMRFNAPGPALADSAKALARAVFREVYVLDNMPAVNSVPPKCSAVVKPHVVKAEPVVTALMGTAGGTILYMEWTVMKPSGELVWKKSFRGEGSDSMWPDKNAQKALEQIFPASFTNMYQSPAIRALAQPSPSTPATIGEGP